MGSWSAVADLLDLLATQGPSFGLCEVFWPSGDPSFPTFLKEVGHPLQFRMVLSCWDPLFSAVPSSLTILLILFLTRSIVYKTYYLVWKTLVIDDCPDILTAQCFDTISSTATQYIYIYIHKFLNDLKFE